MATINIMEKIRKTIRNKTMVTMATLTTMVFMARTTTMTSLASGGNVKALAREMRILIPYFCLRVA